MAMSGHKKQSVGIKELKDRASKIIAAVQQSGRAVLITRNNQEVAMMPIPSKPHQRLVAAGLVRPGPKPRPLADLKLGAAKANASPAIRAIIDDRNDR